MSFAAFRVFDHKAAVFVAIDEICFVDGGPLAVLLRNEEILHLALQFGDLSQFEKPLEFDRAFRFETGIVNLVVDDCFYSVVFVAGGIIWTSLDEAGPSKALSAAR